MEVVLHQTVGLRSGHRDDVFLILLQEVPVVVVFTKNILFAIGVIIHMESTVGEKWRVEVWHLIYKQLFKGLRSLEDLILLRV
jgi:hypothetical protein